MDVCVYLGSSGGADAACAPGLLLYGLLRKCCCANLSSHPQPIARLDPQWSRVNAYTWTHTYTYSSTPTGMNTGFRGAYARTEIPAIMRDKSNK